MKKIFILLCVFVSCTSQKATLSPFIQIYKDDWVPNIKPSYIILRTESKTFEIYAPSIDESVFGEWNVKNDTLFLFPKYECFNSDFHKVDQDDLSVITVTQRYLIKKDCLIDVTDYDAAMPEMLKILGNYNIKRVYHRVNGK